MLGKVTCYQGGHELTNMFLRKLLKLNSAYTNLELKDHKIAKKIESFQPANIAVNA